MYKVIQGRCRGALKALVIGKKLSVECTRRLLDSVLVPTLRHRCETIVFLDSDGSEMSSVEMDKNT